MAFLIIPVFSNASLFFLKKLIFVPPLSFQHTQVEERFENALPKTSDLAASDYL